MIGLHAAETADSAPSAARDLECFSTNRCSSPSSLPSSRSICRRGGHCRRSGRCCSQARLFYLWGEPVFVLVLLVSTAFDYALSFHLNKPTPERTRRWALAAGSRRQSRHARRLQICRLPDRQSQSALSPFGPHKIALLHLALPIGVSFVVFEKITYLVDTWRGISKPAASFADYCLFVLFFPKLLAGPILKYHEMKDQIASPPAIEWDDIFAGFLRFARGIGRKLLIADPLGAFATQIFAADPATIGAGYAWLGLACFTLADLFRLCRLFRHGDRARAHARFPAEGKLQLALCLAIADRILAALAHLADHLDPRLSLHTRSAATAAAMRAPTPISGSAFSPPACGTARAGILCCGAPITGCSSRSTGCSCARRCNAAARLVATSVTLFIVMIGWAIFRSENTAHIGPFLAALFGKSQASGALEVPPEVPLALVIGAVISLFPATRLYPWLVRQHEQHVWLQSAHHRRAARDLSAGAGARVCGAVPALHLFQVLTMNRFALTRPLTRLIVGASLLLLPLISAWNLLMPTRQIQIGPTLGGVTNEMPVVFSWSAIRDGSFQKAVADRVTEAFALRRMLIRINNEVRMELFGELTAPNVVRGAKGQLIERTLSRRLLHAHRRPGRGACGEKHSEAAGYPELLCRPRRAVRLCAVAVEGRASAGIFRRQDALPEHAGRAHKIRRRICRRAEAGRHQRAGYRNPDPFAEGRLRFRPVPARRRALERRRRRARRLSAGRRDQPAGRPADRAVVHLHLHAVERGRRRPRTGRSAQRVLSAARLSDAEGEIHDIAALRRSSGAAARDRDGRLQLHPSARRAS